MRKILQLLLIASCGLAISEQAARVVNAQGKPVKDHPHFYDAGGAPASLDQLFDKSTVVVDGVVQGEHPADVVYRDPDPTKPPAAVLTLTNYDIAVREVFKTAALILPNSVLQMQLPGGRRDRGQFIEDEFDSRLPTPKIGEEYVLFLRIATDPTGTSYMPTMGLGESVFLKHGATIVPRGSGPVAQSYHDRLFSDLLDTLRRRGGKLQ